jgi:hypothetical protein
MIGWMNYYAGRRRGSCGSNLGHERRTEYERASPRFAVHTERIDALPGRYVCKPNGRRGRATNGRQNNHDPRRYEEGSQPRGSAMLTSFLATLNCADVKGVLQCLFFPIYRLVLTKFNDQAG